MGGAYLCGVVVLIQHPPLSPSAKGNTAEHPSQTTSRCVEGISNSTELLSSRLQGWMQGWMPPTCQDGGSQVSAIGGRRCIPRTVQIMNKTKRSCRLCQRKFVQSKKRKEKETEKKRVRLLYGYKTSCGWWLCFVLSLLCLAWFV